MAMVRKSHTLPQPILCCLYVRDCSVFLFVLPLYPPSSLEQSHYTLIDEPIISCQLHLNLVLAITSTTAIVIRPIRPTSFPRQENDAPYLACGGGGGSTTKKRERYQVLASFPGTGYT